MYENNTVLLSAGVNDVSKTQDFYNTTNLEGQDLIDAVKQAKTQQDAVYQFFKKRPGYEFTPFEVWSLLRALRPDMVAELTPVTSIRRAITNLTNAQPPLLKKTSNQKEERLGAKNFTWKLYQPHVKPYQTEIPF
jgi:hypothetical protein